LSRVIKPEELMEAPPYEIVFNDISLLFDEDKEYVPNSMAEGDGVSLEMEALSETDEGLKEADRKAEFIIEKARLEAEKIKESAFSEGFAVGKEQGLAEGKATAMQEVVSALELLKRVHKEMQEFQNRLEKENHKAALALALGIAKKIIKKEVLTDEDIVMRVIIDALDTLMNLRKPETLVVRVNPEDLAIVEGSLSGLKSVLSGVDEFSIEADPNVARGGCALETNLGCVDAQIETQLDAVEKSLLQQMEDVLTDEHKFRG
jgi:flagellar assembly protein FliH